MVSLVSRDIPNFLAPTPSRFWPPPHRRISGPKKFGFGFLFLAWIEFFQVRDVPTQIPGHRGHSLSKTTEKGHLRHKVFVWDITTPGSLMSQEHPAQKLCLPYWLLSKQENYYKKMSEKSPSKKRSGSGKDLQPPWPLTRVIWALWARNGRKKVPGASRPGVEKGWKKTSRKRLWKWSKGYFWVVLDLFDFFQPFLTPGARGPRNLFFRPLLGFRARMTLVRGQGGCKQRYVGDAPELFLGGNFSPEKNPDVWVPDVPAFLNSEEGKRATTDVQNGLVFFIIFSFILFSSLWTKAVVKPLDSKKKSWTKNYEKLWKSVKLCGKVPKSVKKVRRFCPSVVPFSFSLRNLHLGSTEEGPGEGLAEKVGKGLAKGWRRVGKGLAKGWQRVGGFPCTLQFCNSRGARW